MLCALATMKITAASANTPITNAIYTVSNGMLDAEHHLELRRNQSHAGSNGSSLEPLPTLKSLNAPIVTCGTLKEDVHLGVDAPKKFVCFLIQHGRTGRLDVHLMAHRISWPQEPVQR